MNFARLLFFTIPLLAGCAHERELRVTGPYPESLWIKPCLRWWTSVCSTNATNHYYVVAVHGGWGDALVYWKEERTIMDYSELVPEAKGGEAMAWHHKLKLDRDTADTWEDVGGSTYMITHRLWVEWMEQCLSRGREYVISLNEARRLYPEKNAPGDP